MNWKLTDLFSDKYQITLTLLLLTAMLSGYTEKINAATMFLRRTEGIISFQTHPRPYDFYSYMQYIYRKISSYKRIFCCYTTQKT